MAKGFFKKRAQEVVEPVEAVEKVVGETPEEEAERKPEVVPPPGMSEDRRQAIRRRG